MNKLASKLSPSITSMIKFDHTHVIATFHQYRTENSAMNKQGLVNTACVALEIHSQLEEEIFYPAMRAVMPSDPTLAESVPEHDEMRRLITRLRGMHPDDAQYDATFMELIRDVLHHVADEETILLPMAEKLLGPRLGELGAEMTKRRLQLVAPRAGEIAGNMARGMPATSMLMAAGALLAGTYFVTRGSTRRAQSEPATTH